MHPLSRCSMRTNDPGHATRNLARRALMLLAFAWMAGPAARGEGAPNGPILSLANGGFLPGEWTDSDRPRSLRWQSPAFAGPFDFDLGGVDAIRFSAAGAAPMPAGMFGFELSGGDVLFGALVGLDDKAADLDVPRLGRLRVDRSHLHRIFRWADGADLAYNGPDGLEGWREVAPPKTPADPQNRVAKFGARLGRAEPRPAAPAAPSGPKWREASGPIFTDQDGATVQADIPLPARAAIDVELSWKARPDFVLALGVGGDEATAARAFRFEVWDGRIVALRETETEADLAPIQSIPAGPGRVRLRCFLDQERGRFLVASAAGEPLADLTVGGASGPPRAGVRLANVRGDVRLERLRIGAWDGSTPRPGDEDRGRVLLADGSSADGWVVRFDADSKEFVLARRAGESRLAQAQVVGVLVSPRSEEPPRAVRAVNRDGSQLSGEWAGVDRGAPVLTVPGFAAPVRLPASGLRSIEFARPKGAPAGEVAAGTLEIDGHRLPGDLVDVEAGGLAWRPQGSETGRPLRPGASGRVVYRSAPAAPQINRVVARRVVAPRAGIQRPAPAAVDRSLPPIPPSARRVFLRTGDVVPAEVARIDEAGATIRSTVTATTFIPNDRIKAVELAAESASGAASRVEKSKRERLLTIPRMQKGSPPTHLIRSRSGDFLRGRVVGMDDKTIRVEVRLEEQEVPRDRVSRIIWLHPDETDPAKAPSNPPATDGPTRVQAIRSDGLRLTFLADRFADATLFGKSDVLGDCKVRAQDLDTLLIGGAIDQEASRLAYQQWKLQNAPEPKSASAEGGAASDGTESALVGKPAPDFTLDLLGGKTFHLADSKGKVVVLDFWATWCGPCLQAMPQIDRATREFTDKGVILVAVNLQEAPAQIAAMLDRQKLSPVVALDRDGAVAGKYAANAIPQTVVIDRSGKVARLFIGGGPHLEDQLREALKALTPAVKE